MLSYSVNHTVRSEEKTRAAPGARNLPATDDDHSEHHVDHQDSDQPEGDEEKDSWNE